MISGERKYIESMWKSRNKETFSASSNLKLTELSLPPNAMHSKFVLRKKSVIRTIFKMIADGMNNAQNEWVCNITERFRERTMFCNFLFTCTESSYFQEHFTFVTAVSLENLDMSNRKVVIRTYKGSTVAGLARRTSKEGVLISPSTINLESFDIDIKFVLRICILKLAFQNW